MARLNRFTFVCLAIVFHLVYIASIFDIYFVSPIVHGMRAFSVPRPPGKPPPASRLVLIVGDGLRADKAFQSFPDPAPADLANPTRTELAPRPLMPFLRSKVEKEGTFGVSHTRMPTESRPGHVALIAGLYEDVSAVTTGWKLNPVDFDSVFNRSRHTWSWGSPDILPMFVEGAVPGRVEGDTYGHEFEDYSQDAKSLDYWVFDKVEAMFEAARNNKTTERELRMEKNVFFLHLLGLDTTGHSYRPTSREYLHNIKVVDEGVRRISKIIDDFYGDDRTAYVFTADHGMSDWGSHGDGHPDNTRTPLIAWGAGVARPIVSKDGTASGHEDGFSHDWGLSHITRHDVAQADVAALMAYLAGLEFPTNSEGKLPLPFVSGGPTEKAEAMLVNARGILEMYQVKEEHKKAVELNYQPYLAFSSDTDDHRSIQARLAGIRSTIDSGEYDSAIAKSQELIELGLQGLRYLQTYDWFFLRAIITLGYLGYMAFALTTVVDLHVLHGKTETSRDPLVTGAFGAILVGLYAVLWIKKSPITFYIYVVCPVAFWEEVCARRKALVAGKHALLGVGNRKMTGFVFQAILAIGFLEALLFSYFFREIYSVIYVLAALYPLQYGSRFISSNKLLMSTWATLCILMSLFTLLPVVKVEDINLILLSGAVILIVGGLYILFERSILASSKSGAAALGEANNLSRTVLGIQLGLILLAMTVTRSSVQSLSLRQGLPLGNQVVGWLVLIASLTVPFIHSRQPNKHYLNRLVIIFLSFAPVFIILTISYEGLFYFVFSMLLVTWVRLEHHIFTHTRKGQPSPPSLRIVGKELNDMVSDTMEQITSTDEGTSEQKYRALQLSDARIALFFFFLIQSAFFSTGNIASVSSFSLDSVFRLIPIFDPFSQGALLILKLLIPFAVLSANLSILNRRLHVAPSALFMVVMAVSDVLTLNFFWMVKDEGSWLDIGTSISHFSISSLLCAFIAVMELGGEVFVSGVEVGDENGPPKSKSAELKKAKGNAIPSNGPLSNGNANGITR